MFIFVVSFLMYLLLVWSGGAIPLIEVLIALILASVVTVAFRSWHRGRKVSTRGLDPKRWFGFFRYLFGPFAVGLAKANIDVAKIVLFKPSRELQPAWLVVPLEITTPEAIAVLMGTITLTPGTVSCDLAEDGSALLVHALHCPDPESSIDEMKTRYEARLKEIFL